MLVIILVKIYTFCFNSRNSNCKSTFLKCIKIRAFSYYVKLIYKAFEMFVNAYVSIVKIKQPGQYTKLMLNLIIIICYSFDVKLNVKIPNSLN